MLDLTGKKTVVLDAHGIIYQVFHTMREMSGPKGQPTGAAYGFTRDVINILLKFEPDEIFCAFDMPGKTFRHEIYAPYKANRPPMPDDLRPQMVFVRHIIDALGIPRLEKDLYEADDILATVARQAAEAGGSALLITSDKDARQLISDSVLLYNLRKEEIYDADALMKDWGIVPGQVVDFQTMVGDSTDNVPGIPLIGPKSATALLNQYGTLEEIFAHAGEIKGKKGENIAAAREQAGITRSLVKLDDRVPIEIDWEQGKPRGIDADRLHEIFLELGFRSLLPQIAKLADRFGTRTIEPDRSLESLFSLSETGTENPNAAEPERKRGGETPAKSLSLFDDTEPDREEPGTDAAGGAAESRPVYTGPALAEENRPVTDRLFHTLGGTAAADYPEIETEPEFPAEPQYELVDTPEAFNRLMDRLDSVPVLSLDLETVDRLREPKARPRFALIAGVALCFEPARAYYIALRGPAGAPVLSEQDVLERLRPVLESESVKKIGQNIKYDTIVLRNYGIKLAGILFDTMVADYLLRAGEQRHNMDELAEHYLGHKTVKIGELIGKGKSQKMIDEVPTADVAHYAGEDALVPWYLYPILLAGLRRQPALLRLMSELEIPLISVLVEMETNGIAINPAQFEKLRGIFSARLNSIVGEIGAIVKRDAPDSVFADGFNLNSPKQLQQLLFDDLKLPVIKKTKTGLSTDVSVLEELAVRGFELPAKIMQHRTLTKLIGTYVEPIPRLVHPITGRIHASFNQAVAETGRLSSSDPNLQNIPVRSEEGKEIRHGFVPDKRLGFDTFVSCDYSQVELRVLAHFSKDPNLMKAYQDDLDIHAAVAAQIFGVPIAQVTSEQRRKAKAVNFGLAYGQTAFGLAKSLGIPQGEAAEYISGFFATYSGIRDFFARVLAEAAKNGYVTTLLGRRRAIEGVRPDRGEGKPLNMPERTAINTVIQGSAADLMKAAMVNVSRRLADWNKGYTSGPAAAFLSAPLLKPAEPKKPAGGFLFDMEDDPPQTTDTEPAGSSFFAPEIENPRGRVLLQIHDELLLETRRSDAEELAKLVTEEMELGQPLAVPLKIDVEYGETW